mgnify:FL=1
MKREWIKWWKDKDTLRMIGVAFGTMALSLGVLLINPNSLWCIGGCLAIVFVGGRILRRLIDKKINEWK